MRFYKIFVLIILVAITTEVKAQSKYQIEFKEWKDSIETARTKSKAYQCVIDSIIRTRAYEALQANDFVLEGNRLTLKHGETGYVNSTTNFIAMHNGIVTIQISPFQSGGGPNGVGGITVEGKPSCLKIENDKKDNYHLSMNVSGNGVSAQVLIILNNSDNRASVTVHPNFNSLIVKMDGYLVPFEDSNVYKGSAL